jgi:hypothetical protein
MGDRGMGKSWKSSMHQHQTYSTAYLVPILTHSQATPRPFETTGDATCEVVFFAKEARCSQRILGATGEVGDKDRMDRICSPRWDVKRRCSTKAFEIRAV